MSSQSTDDDAAIAEALAREEQERADAELARKMETGQRRTVVVRGRPIINCPGHHVLNEFSVSSARRVRCDICSQTLARNEKGCGCMACNFYVCDACYQRGGPPPTTGQQLQQPHSLQRAPFSFPGTPPRFETPPHMCIVPCVIGNGVCVEMLVDTGAQTSVCSLSLARELGLESRIDKSYQGIAAGVGRARIVGKITNVGCELGHVEFPMDFMVLDVKDQLLLLGLDLMRRYKCIVDMEKDVLVFGGRGGVEVVMLPPDKQHVALRNQFGCPMM